MTKEKEPVFLMNEITDMDTFLKESTNGNLKQTGAIQMLLHNQTIIYALLRKIECKLDKKNG